MTRRQKRSLLRKAKMVVVIGAVAYLVAGIGSLISESAQEPVEKGSAEISVREPVGSAVISNDEIIEAREELFAKTEYQSIICSYDWDIEDAELLCKIAMAEAGNQDTEGKALVMLVVLNRVWGDNEFPDTIRDVIYQPRQFSPVLEGKFEGVVPDKDCWDALELVEAGWDESQGALYFESKSDSTWHEDNLEFLFKHGDHYFYTERN